MIDKRKILLVDDDLDLLEQNKTLIESKGYEVIAANSSKEGWKQFRNPNRTQQFVDLIMEEHDSGFVLCYRIKRMNTENIFPFLFLLLQLTKPVFKFGASTNEEKEWIKADAIIINLLYLMTLLRSWKVFFELKEK